MSSRKQHDAKCAVTRGEVDLHWYAERDAAWRELGLAAPARRALLDAGLRNPRDLSRWSAGQLAQLHGIGKTALTILRPFLSD